ncbi:hypothetical protein MRX96_025464 [Rhipicephalus microplus]
MSWRNGKIVPPSRQWESGCPTTRRLFFSGTSPYGRLLGETGVVDDARQRRIEPAAARGFAVRLCVTARIVTSVASSASPGHTAAVPLSLQPATLSSVVAGTRSFDAALYSAGRAACVVECVSVQSRPAKKKMRVRNARTDIICYSEPATSLFTVFVGCPPLFRSQETPSFGSADTEVGSIVGQCQMHKRPLEVACSLQRVKAVPARGALTGRHCSEQSGNAALPLATCAR